MNPERLARPEIAALRPYRTAVQEPGSVRLNANEAPHSPAAGAATLNRYPEIRPGALQARLAGLYGVDPDRLLATRGSSEAIDLLVRTFCRAYTDNIITTPPTFSMYRVYADMQSAQVIEVPLLDTARFSPDVDGILARCSPDTRLIFICSPNNPTGGMISPGELVRLLRARDGRSLIVVDEAYIEFSGQASLVRELGRFDNLVVLRTLSKAYGLAGARCGAIVAAPAIIDLLAPMLPPYAFSTPTTEVVLQSLSDAGIDRANSLIEATVRERERVSRALTALACVQYVWPSHANFLLARFDNLNAVQRRLQRVRVLIRAFEDNPALAGCARITIGERAENDLLLDTLAAPVEGES